MALSDYMPYGAPELLDGARSRMARSTLLASLTVAMLVSGVGAILDHGVTTITFEPPGANADTLLSPPIDAPQEYRTPPPVRPAAPPTDVDATPVPVPDAAAPPDEIRDAPPLPDVPAGDGPPGAISMTMRGTGMGPATPRDPEPGEIVIVDELPNPIRCGEARYPDLAREAGVEGVVRVLMLVGLDGRVQRAIIAPGGSIPMLDEAALAASRQCVFTPALANGHPVKVWVSRNYHFTLH